jgi:hypothetical protein
MFTFELAGHPIAVTDAEGAGPKKVFDSQEFKDDLRSEGGEGRTLWDGSAIFNIRPASDDEIEAFDNAFGEDDEADEDGINVMFLALLDPTDTNSSAST